MKILLIDDDPFSLKLLSIQLRAIGFSRRGFVDVVSCESGEEACRVLAEEDDIGLIFCDLQMPGMDGVEFIRHLERQGYGGGLVLVSGENERTRQAVVQLAKAHHLNVIAEVGKPVTRDTIERLLDLSIPSREGHGEAPDAGSKYTPQEVSLAIERRELVNHYQPKLDVRTMEVIGLEALVRWQHPLHGLVPPCHFVTLCEEHGLVRALTAEVTRNALRDLRALQDAGHHLNLAINVSLTNVGSLDFPDWLAAQAEAAGIALTDLILEVTESRVMDDPQAQLDVLSRLRLKQVRLSIDDFGTGYSCLAQLRDLPFDELKIDRSFVHGASHDAALRAMVEASLALARELGIKAVAEGVENRADLDLLRKRGCEMAQGYLFSRPLPVDEVGPWITQWREKHS